MRTAKLIGNGLLSLSLVCWIVGCNAEEETSPSTTGPTTTTPSTTPHGTGAEGEDHEHAEGEDHEHADGDADHDHADDADPDIIEEGAEDADPDVIEEGAENEGTEGDAQASTDSLELPEATTADAEETELDLPVVEAGSGT